MTETSNGDKRTDNRNKRLSGKPTPKNIYHGTRADLQPGDVVPPGDPTGTIGEGGDLRHTYVSPNLDAATWSAELAEGGRPPRVYIVETDGAIEDASDLMAENAPRHPYMSWRAGGEVRVKSEVTKWTWYHGTRAALKSGDLLLPGSNPNYGQTLSHVYLTRTLDAAIWAAELALGEGTQKIYIVEPTGPVEDDPNVTNKRFRGNPTKSFRSRDPLRVIEEVTGWEGHTEEAVATMKTRVEKLALKDHGPIND